METKYIENNKRKYEVTQTFSLAMLSSDALMDLKHNRKTDEFHIPEVAYEFVHPGGYCRFIKSVAITVPCVTGPNTNISAKLILHSSKVRRDTNPSKVLDEFPEKDSVLVPLTELSDDT
jgi:Tc toxin complex TcA C-terminal TcB-binding domain